MVWACCIEPVEAVERIGHANDLVDELTNGGLWPHCAPRPHAPITSEARFMQEA